MATIGIVTGTAIANSGVTLRARLTGAGGVPVTQASLVSVTVVVTDLATGSTVATLTPSVASCIFDTPQLDPDWTKDAIGYTFSFTIPSGNSTGGTSLTAAGVTVANRMRADVVFVPSAAGSTPFRQPFEWQPVRVYG